jgi:dienelactone hydrolase
MSLILSQVPRVQAMDLAVPFEDGCLDAELRQPEASRALVLFAHGSGSSRRSPRNHQVADALYAQGLASLCFEFFTPEEAAWDQIHAALRFDIDFISRRMMTVAQWARSDDTLGLLPLAFFGASTGAAAALTVAADLGPAVRAVVSRGGRPDLAIPALPRVRAATLLLVGGRDSEVLALNEQALRHLHCEKVLHVVPGATHLFEEPGALEEVSEHTAEWVLRHTLPKE